MKILILANNDVGLYKFRKEVLKKLLEEKHSVYIALPGGELVVETIKMGCHFYQTEIDRRGMNPIKDFRLFMSYYKLIRKVKPDVILSYTIKPNIYGGLVSRLLDKKYIANITGLGSSIENGGLTATAILKLYKSALKKASCVFFQNNSNMSYMTERNITGKKSRLLPGSGVNLDICKFEEYPSEQEKISFLFLGRIMRDKGITELLEAAVHIKQEYPEIVFNIAGDYEENYFDQIKQLEQKGIISFLGFRSDTHELMKRSFAIILPSYHEGMSNVLLEAAACGRPILASRIPGCLEIFEEGISGLGFNVRDSESLELTLKAFIGLSYEEKKQMGFHARKRVEKEFDRNIVIEAYLEEIYRAVGKEK